MMTDLRIAYQSAMVDLDGVQQHVRRGRTLAVADHPIVAEHPELWRPLVVDYDVEAPAAGKPKAAPAKKATKSASKSAEE